MNIFICVFSNIVMLSWSDMKHFSCFSVMVFLFL
jgi:hypothetical protein